ncbi:hypothetical protein ACH5RR_022493 [Cinchona calisaya]|uniref:Late embryogenesis abundant protein LEA-2 subgroup domain-containing protein n=1 Tax=Cinchona calisaya TaxID=153742 RepID=A0ABD2Z9S8_9GENT
MTSTPPNAVNGTHRPHQPPHHRHPNNNNNNNNNSSSSTSSLTPHYPPHINYYPPHSSSSSSKASLKGCCCCLFLLFSLLFLITLAVILVVVLAVKPKKPQFDLQSVGVQYLGINPTPIPLPTTSSYSAASVSLAIRMLFVAVNDNKVGIKYGESKFTVMYRGIPLGRGIVPGFYQPAHSVRQVQTTIAVDRVNLLQTDAADLVRDATVNDRVELRVVGDIGAKIRILGFTSPGVQVSVDCAIDISPRKQALLNKQCGFDGLSV